MQLSESAKILRVYIGESDRHHGRLLHEQIVEEARKAGLAGATVLRGIMGFGANSRIHTARILRLSEDLPIIIEIVDKPGRIEAFLPRLDELVDDGLVVIEDVRVIAYRHRQKK